MAKSNEQVLEEFDDAVNMSRKELEDWLQTEESQSGVRAMVAVSPRATSRGVRSTRSSGRTSQITPTRTSTT
jgi:CBS-domain-containing membrane protein